MELENSASQDAAVREKIANLPAEVQDVSLLEKIEGKVFFLFVFFLTTPYVVFSSKIDENETDQIDDQINEKCC